MLGGGWGAGFESNVEEAFRFLSHNHREGDRIFVFGFSRGAAQARALTHFLDWLGGIPAKADAYFGPLFFLHYVRTRGAGRPDEVTTADGRRPDQPLVPVTIEFLGVWDTVMALGSRFHATRETSTAGRVVLCFRHSGRVRQERPASSRHRRGEVRLPTRGVARGRP